MDLSATLRPCLCNSSARIHTLSHTHTASHCVINTQSYICLSFYVTHTQHTHDTVHTCPPPPHTHASNTCPPTHIHSVHTHAHYTHIAGVTHTHISCPPPPKVRDVYSMHMSRHPHIDFNNFTGDAAHTAHTHSTHTQSPVPFSAKKGFIAVLMSMFAQCHLWDKLRRLSSLFRRLSHMHPSTSGCTLLE